MAWLRRMGPRRSVLGHDDHHPGRALDNLSVPGETPAASEATARGWLGLAGEAAASETAL